MIIETSYTERVLIVLNRDGTLKGAHAEVLKEVRDDLTILAARPETVPLAAEALILFLPQHSALLAQVVQLQSMLEQTTKERDDLAADLSACMTKLDSREADLAARTTERDTFEAELNVRTTKCDQLETSLALRTSERDQTQAALTACTTERDALTAQIAATEAAARRSVSPLQARKALRAAGMLTKVQEIVSSATEDDDMRLAWDWAVSWERDSPFVASLGAALGLTAGQIDDLFTQAAAL